MEQLFEYINLITNDDNKSFMEAVKAGYHSIFEAEAKSIDDFPSEPENKGDETDDSDNETAPDTSDANDKPDTDTPVQPSENDKPAPDVNKEPSAQHITAGDLEQELMSNGIVQRSLKAIAANMNAIKSNPALAKNQSMAVDTPRNIQKNVINVAIKKFITNKHYVGLNGDEVQGVSNKITNAVVDAITHGKEEQKPKSVAENIKAEEHE